MSILVKKNEDSEIFGGTFKRVAQNSGSFCTGDGLWDTGESVGGIDHDRPTARGTDLDQEGGGNCNAFEKLWRSSPFLSVFIVLSRRLRAVTAVIQIPVSPYGRAYPQDRCRFRTPELKYH